MNTSPKERETVDPYDALRCAVVGKAVDDYKRALKGNNKSRISECENFFRSQYFEFWNTTKLNGEEVIAGCRETVARELEEKKRKAEEKALHMIAKVKEAV